MKEKNDVTKLEFLLTLNDNIIVQRYYNVKGYNEDVKNSLDLYYVVSEIEGKIHRGLKMNTVSYMLENQYQIMSDPNIMETSMTDDDEYFNIFIKVNDTTIFHKSWDGKIYPPKVRYTVDVRPHLKSILKSLTEVFSSDKLTCEFMDYKLG